VRVTTDVYGEEIAEGHRETGALMSLILRDAGSRAALPGPGEPVRPTPEGEGAGDDRRLPGGG